MLDKDLIVSQMLAGQLFIEQYVHSGNKFHDIATRIDQRLFRTSSHTVEALQKDSHNKRNMCKRVFYQKLNWPRSHPTAYCVMTSISGSALYSLGRTSAAERET